MQEKQDQQELAPFDDCRAALAFALNADQVTAPTAFMNKAMAAVRVEAKKPRKKRTTSGVEAILLVDTASAEELLELERQAIRGKRGGSLVRVQALKWRTGMDKHHQAGLILHHFGRLETEHQVVLAGLITNAYVPCSCRNLCCSGRRPTERWLKALSDMCTIIQLRADVVKQPGKKGLSSQPLLRRRVVEEFFTKAGRSLVDIAREAKVSTTTVAEHRALILAYLEDCEAKAWAALMPLFDEAGITGHHL